MRICPGSSPVSLVAAAGAFYDDERSRPENNRFNIFNIRRSGGTGCLEGVREYLRLIHEVP